MAELPNCYRCECQPCECRDGITLYCADCREVLPGLEEGSVQCCVTSPPYWGLRDYGTATWDGGDEACDHQPPDDGGKTDKPTVGQRQHAGRFSGPICHKCGAHRIDAQIGLEQTPDDYVAEMVGVFREVRRVLRDDGTLWLNLGDSYNGIGGPGKQDGGPVGPTAATAIEGTKGRHVVGLKKKDLVGIPWRVALALQADGWYLRQDIIWHKPNPMPESVTDRCTKAHEYVFMLSKSARYFYDGDAIREPYNQNSLGRYKYQFDASTSPGRQKPGNTDFRYLEKDSHGPNPLGRNRRSVWTVATKPFKGAHFAVFPPDLIKPCIMAGCPEGGVVLDPFMGSGTTAEVARKQGCRCIGTELNADYLALAANRLRQEVMF